MKKKEGGVAGGRGGKRRGHRHFEREWIVVVGVLKKTRQWRGNTKTESGDGEEMGWGR